METWIAAPAPASSSPVARWRLERQLRIEEEASCYKAVPHEMERYAIMALPFTAGVLAARRRALRRPRRVTMYQAVQRAWCNLPPNYNWDICTQQNYAESEPVIIPGKLEGARKLVDSAYHGYYTRERQRFQDDLVTHLVENNGRPRQAPMLLFTAGAMGVGKTFVINWLRDNGILSVADFVKINPDKLAKQLPEWVGYDAYDHSSAAVMTRLEAGYLSELTLLYALQQRRNILVDSSLRHGKWYSRVLQKIREKLDDVTVVLMYIHACEETVYQRAVERGHNGRAVSPAEVADSLEKLPRALQKLLPYTDSFIQVNNNFDEPQVTSVCQQLRGEDTSSCQVSEDIESMGEVGWSGVSGVLQQARGGEPAEPLPEPPAILPASGSSQPKPMSTLFHTIAFAATKHKHQTRKNPQKTPYINHPLAVARILAEVGIRDLPTLQAALLHDTLEDTDTSAAELSATFGEQVRELVDSLTDDDSLRPVHKKLVQLRSAGNLPPKAKLVRIADKLHNVWDLVHHGIPSWPKERTERYIAWACEMVAALEGTHTALEERFHAEVSLPAGYELGDWERFAQEQMRHLEDWEHVHVDDNAVSEQAHTPELDEQRAVLSLLKAAEYVASRNGSQLIDSVKFALLLTEYGIKDPETLKAGLLLGTANGHDRVIAKEFGNEVADILRGLDATFPSVESNPKANRVCLGKRLHELRKLQWGTLASPEDIEKFRTLLEETRSVRTMLTGCHPQLEEALDDVFNGQVRLASGELTPASLESLEDAEFWT
ncbi:hddc3 [Symbiodinium natans]|uniref:Guanosine-3',5'-bis(diphosphate) 3'-pyrophosphohydrolase MESH1 n=1 Tax=Symbiodinium natans TaxID=878477 RepID=A0A812QA78_9DINO|nr:hddc3 [Symbiodinium natans]